jgi:NADH:ubiquinone oxidoreductase subunit 6 (subunit J)
MIFAIMLTPESMRTEGTSRFTAQWPIAAVLASGLLVVLVPPILSTPWPVKNDVPLDEARNYAVELGMAFMSPEASGYLLPFWLAAAFLLVALVGAIVIAREDI